VRWPQSQLECSCQLSWCVFVFFPTGGLNDRKPSRVTPFFPHFSREDQWYKYLMPSQPQPTTCNLRCCAVWWECCVTVAMPLGQNAPQQMRLLGWGGGVAMQTDDSRHAVRPDMT
jgi:hypothetical protein